MTHSRLVVSLALATLLAPSTGWAQVPVTTGWVGTSAAPVAPSVRGVDPSTRPYLQLSDRELDDVERGAWEETGLGIAIILGSAALGIGGGIGLGIASEIHGPVTRCSSWWTTTCTTSDGIVGHDSLVLGAAIVVGVVGLVSILTAGIGLIHPARQRRGRVHVERRYREEESSDLALSVTSDSAFVSFAGRFEL